MHFSHVVLYLFHLDFFHLKDTKLWFGYLGLIFVQNLKLFSCCIFFKQSINNISSSHLYKWKKYLFESHIKRIMWYGKAKDFRKLNKKFMEFS